MTTVAAAPMLIPPHMAAGGGLRDTTIDYDRLAVSILDAVERGSARGTERGATKGTAAGAERGTIEGWRKVQTGMRPSSTLVG